MKTKTKTGAKAGSEREREERYWNVQEWAMLVLVGLMAVGIPAALLIGATATALAR